MFSFLCSFFHYLFSLSFICGIFGVVRIDSHEHQEAATSTQSASSDSNDSCDDEKMILTIAAEDQDGNDSN